MLTAPNTTLTPELCATDCCDREAMRHMVDAVAEVQATLRELMPAALVAVAMSSHPDKTPAEAAKREAARLKRECAALVTLSKDVQANINTFQQANLPKMNAAVRHLDGLRVQLVHQEANRRSAGDAQMEKRAKMAELGLPEAEIDRLAPMEQSTAVLDAEIARLHAEIELVEAYLRTSAAGPLPFKEAA